MFIGHFAAGLAGKKAAPEVSLGTLFFAGMLVDVIWAVLLLLGVEHARIVPGFTRMVPLDLYDIPYSHSMAGALLWSFGLGGIYYFFKRNRKAAFVVGAVVFSHWVLDFLVHPPDLPIAPGLKSLLGLGMWNYPAASILVEGAFFMIGVALYVQTTSARNLAGHLAFWPVPLLLAFLWMGNMTNTPPSVTVVAASTLSMLILVPWGAWADRNRQPVFRCDIAAAPAEV